ncbi:cytochrome c [Hydrogenophaga sp. OTU3427]|uniref:cytochrome c n=1 Tax=Hydrogenophaga sp. OTU3427 TaxID=3043856 RepID=UPI00313D1463
MTRWTKSLLGLLALLLLAAALVAWLNVRGEAPLSDAPPGAPADAATLERGRQLATAGNCQACHSARGGEPYAGGRGIATPFGTVYAGNLTPDPTHGLGQWNSDAFWRALHHGRSRDGRLLYPAFPYNNTTLVTRDDSDAIYHYLRSLPPVAQANRPHELRWPFSTQAALAVWRALYFRPASFEPAPQQNAEWNRGAYLVQGLAHCSACHAPRNALGASSNMLDLAGGLIPLQNWYAPSLNAPQEAGVQNWPLDHIVALFRDGRAPGGQVTGPMAEVVLHSTQHWREDELRAMASYLKALPRVDLAQPAPAAKPASRTLELGAQLYGNLCASCHGERGEGIANAYPALAGNRAVLMGSPANLVQTVLNGGFSPATAGHPRPYGMPPYLLSLSDADIAAVLTHVRGSWGNQAGAVGELDVLQLRGGR